MKRIVGDWSTKVILEGDEPKTICKLGQGEKCCAYLVCGEDGFECVRMNYPANASIIDRLEKGTMNAKGKGEWKGCAWENKKEESNGN